MTIPKNARRALILTLLSSSVLMGGTTHPKTVQAAETLSADIDVIKSLATAQKYDEALTALDKIEKQNPNNSELRLERARILSWKKDFTEAENILETLPQNNTDVQITQAYLAYYQGQLPKARAILEPIRAQTPNNKDAEEAYLHIQAAEKAQIILQETKRPRTRIDIGGEYSGFERRDQPSWWQEFAHIAHRLENEKTTLGFHLADYRQFKDDDKEIAADISHAFTKWFSATALIGTAPDSDFKPRWKSSLGAEVNPTSFLEKSYPLFATFDLNHDAYRTARVNTWKYGFRYEFSDTWKIASRMIRTAQNNVPSVYGWDARLDGEIIQGLRFNTSYADAGETVSGTTVKTISVSTGFSIDLTKSHTLRFGYTNEDREKSYIRHVANANLSYIF